MEYSSKAAMYPALTQEEKVSEFQKLEYYNELIKYIGIINALLGAKSQEVGYEKIDEVEKASIKSLRLLNEYYDNERGRYGDLAKDYINSINELRFSTGEFVENNFK